MFAPDVAVMTERVKLALPFSRSSSSGHYGVERDEMIAKLTDENRRLKQAISESVGPPTGTASHTAGNHAQQQIATLQRQLSEAKPSYDSEIQSMQQLHDEYSEKSQRVLAKRDGVIQKLMGEIKDLHASLLASDERAISIAKTLRKYSTQLAASKSEYDRCEQMRSNLQTEYDNLKATLNRQISEKNEKIKQLEKETQSQTVKQRLQSNLKLHLLQTALEEKTSQYDSYVSEQEEVIKNIQENLARKEQIRTDLSYDLEESKESLRQQVLEYGQLKSETNTERASLKSAILAKEREIESLKSDIAQQTQQLEQSLQDKEALETDLRERVALYNQLKSATNAERSILESTITQQSVSLGECETVRSTLQTQLDNLATLLSVPDISSVHATVQRKLEELDSTSNALSATQEKLKTSLRVLSNPVRNFLSKDRHTNTSLDNAIITDTVNEIEEIIASNKKLSTDLRDAQVRLATFTSLAQTFKQFDDQQMVIHAAVVKDASQLLDAFLAILSTPDSKMEKFYKELNKTIQAWKADKVKYTDVSERLTAQIEIFKAPSSSDTTRTDAITALKKIHRDNVYVLEMQSNLKDFNGVVFSFAIVHDKSIKSEYEKKTWFDPAILNKKGIQQTKASFEVTIQRTGIYAFTAAALSDSFANVSDLYKNVVVGGTFDSVANVKQCKSLVCFGYGFSGSGKTYALLKDPVNSVIAKTISNNVKGTSFLDESVTDGFAASTVTLAMCFELYGQIDITNSVTGNYREKVMHALGRVGNQNMHGRCDSCVGFIDYIIPHNLENVGFTSTNDLWLELYEFLKNVDKHRRECIPPRIIATTNNPESSRSHLFIVLKMTSNVSGSCAKPRYVVVCDCGGMEDPMQMAHVFVDKSKHDTATDRIYHDGVVPWDQNRFQSLVGKNLTTEARMELAKQEKGKPMRASTIYDTWIQKVSGSTTVPLWIDSKHTDDKKPYEFVRKKDAGYVVDQYKVFKQVMSQALYINESLFHLRVFFQLRKNSKHGEHTDSELKTFISNIAPSQDGFLADLDYDSRAKYDKTVNLISVDELTEAYTHNNNSRVADPITALKEFIKHRLLYRHGPNAGDAKGDHATWMVGSRSSKASAEKKGTTNEFMVKDPICMMSLLKLFDSLSSNTRFVMLALGNKQGSGGSVALESTLAYADACGRD